MKAKILGLLALGLLAMTNATATPFYFSTGDPDGKMAMASRPGAGGAFEIQSADDFVLGQQTTITGATFTGLLTGGATTADIRSIAIEIYRVFPYDSTSPPSGDVPTRVNSPADVAFATRDSTVSGQFTFSISTLSSSFTAANSVLPGGIHSLPNSTTGGDGSVAGMEVQFNLAFLNAFDLPADHYFFVPEVQLANGVFLWLSAPRPIVPPGTTFPAGFTDLQAWTRDAYLEPDWLRVGTDIVGGSPAPTYNAVFSLTGESAPASAVPEPGTLALLGLGLAGLGLSRRRIAN